MIVPIVCEAQCTGAGPRNGASAQNNTSVGSITWTNLTNVFVSDNTYAAASRSVAILSTINTNYAYLKSLGFSIPADATICGIKVDVARRASGISIGATVSDNTVQLLKSGVLTGSNKASLSNWPTSKTTASYGSNSDSWGSTWSPADINDPDFGVALSAKMFSGLISLVLTANVDNISVTVYYTTMVLPVELSEFSAQSQERSVHVQWVTKSESNTDYFSLERSADTLAWLPITIIQAAGFSTNDLLYTYEDENPLPSAYYRLAQVDRDGNRKYYGPLAVTLIEDKPYFVLSPNPFSEEAEISTDDNPKELFLINSSGARFNLSFVKISSEKITFNSDQIPAGNYVLCYIGEKRTVVRRVIVSK